MIQTVGIVGMGALGVLYGSELRKKMSREDLLIIADEARIARYTTQGLFANGEKCDFCFAAPDQAQEVDLLLFMTKYPALAQAAQLARPFCGENTVVISFLNGVSSEGILAEILKPKKLLYCSVQGMDATRQGSNVMYSKTGYIAFGERDNSRSETVQAVADFFDAMGLAYRVPEDIMHQLWSKWMLNVGVNQTCAAFDVDYAGVQQPGALREKMYAAMEEARCVANAEGIALTRKELEDWVAVMDSLAPNGKPSMRQDVLAQRPSEVGLFAGVVCELGRKHAIPVPVNDAFLQLLG